LKRQPKDVDSVHNNLGNALLQQGRAAEAIPHYQQALAGKPESPEYHNNLGTALLASGRPALAIPEFKKAVELNPRNAYSLLYWAMRCCNSARKPPLWNVTGKRCA